MCLTMCEYSINVHVQVRLVYKTHIEESVLQIINMSLCQYYKICTLYLNMQ